MTAKPETCYPMSLGTRAAQRILRDARLCVPCARASFGLMYRYNMDIAALTIGSTRIG
jgi:hypothetical protein